MILSPILGKKEKEMGNRTKCPFHGFLIPTPGILMDNEGNACALEGGFTPCKIKISGGNPCWEECNIFNHPENQESIERLIANAKIFPKEFHPAGQQSWAGISLSSWVEHIKTDDPEKIKQL